MRRRGSLVRDILFPFYTLDQIGFVAAFLAAGLGVLALFGDPAAAVVLVCAYFGATGVLFTTAPGVLSGPGSARLRVETCLRRWNFQPVGGRDRWTAPIPGWLKWSNSNICIRQADDQLEVTGPLSTLHFLARTLCKEI